MELRERIKSEGKSTVQVMEAEKEPGRSDRGSLTGDVGGNPDNEVSLSQGRGGLCEGGRK